jgi:cobalt-zinc-cadmium efflux system outer membrane protein
LTFCSIQQGIFMQMMLLRARAWLRAGAVRQRRAAPIKYPLSRTLCLAALLAVGSVQAQQTTTLKQAFETAWARQPEARGGDLRRAAADARRDAAGNWLVAAPSLEVSAKSDRVNSDKGTREYDVGVGLPLWLPGERGGAQALADAEGDALLSRLRAAQLRVAADIRDAWWAAVFASIEVEVATARLKNAEQLAGDVGRRVRAGDLSPRRRLCWLRRAAHK